LTNELSFDKGIYVVIRAIQMLSEYNQDTIVLAIAGPSGSGKSTFTDKVKALLPGCVVLSMDSYNDGSKVIDGNFDDPRIIDFDTLISNIKDLKGGRSTQVPIYSFKESRRTGYRTVAVPESHVIIVEGIYALSQRISPLIDLRTSIQGGVHRDVVKRVLRDIDRSGQAPDEIIDQIGQTVWPMFKAFIEPDLKAAHIRIYNTFNPFSGFSNPTFILKSMKEVSVEDVKKVLGHAAPRYHSESETYDIYLVPPGEDPETCQSWMRMRYRDGKYNLMFEEWVVEGKFIISPRVTFDVPVRILGGLMALGYEIGTIMERTSEWWTNEKKDLTIKIDTVHGLEGRKFVQVQGKDRAAVDAAGKALGLEGFYLPRSYIEFIQFENLTSEFQKVTEDLKRKFAVNGEPLIDEAIVGSLSRGSSPLVGSFQRTIGFKPTGEKPVLSSSLPSNSALMMMAANRQPPPSSSTTTTAAAAAAAAAVAVPARPAAPPSSSSSMAVGTSAGNRGDGLLSQHMSQALDINGPPRPNGGSSRGGTRVAGAGNGSRSSAVATSSSEEEDESNISGGSRRRALNGSGSSSKLNRELEGKVEKILEVQDSVSCQLEDISLQLSLLQQTSVDNRKNNSNNNNNNGDDGDGTSEIKPTAARMLSFSNLGGHRHDDPTFIDSLKASPVVWAAVGAVMGVTATLLVVRRTG
jgi:uridine kinase/adenylate cyclase class IV